MVQWEEDENGCSGWTAIVLAATGVAIVLAAVSMAIGAESSDSDDSDEEVATNRTPVEEAAIASDGLVQEPTHPLDQGTSWRQAATNPAAGAASDTPPAPPAGQRGKAPKRSVSIADEAFKNEKIVFAHVDVEDGGPFCGLLQLSAVFMGHDFKVLGWFDRFIKPRDNAIWNEEGCRLSHGYTKDTPEIVNANNIEVVWKEFADEVEKHVGGDKVGVLVAWAGKGSEISKMFNVVEDTHKGTLFFPKELVYFCDPAKVIGHYKSCRLHDDKRTSGRKGYGLGLVYCEAFGKEMDAGCLPDPSHVANASQKGAHNSIVDTFGQAQIFADPRVNKFINKPASIEKISDIWKAKQQQKVEAKAEISRPVPNGYIDEGDDNWQLPKTNQYHGYGGGGVAGPSSAVTTACNNRELADLFMFFITMEMLETIAKETNRYGNEQPMKPADAVEWRARYFAEEETGADEASGATTDDSSTVDTPESEAAADDDDESQDPDYASDEDDEDEGMILGIADLIDADSDDDDDDSVLSFDDDPDGKVRGKLRRLIPLKRGETHPEQRFRYRNASRKWVEVTPGYLLAWFGILLIIGATKMRSWRILWMESQALNCNWIQNAMSFNSFQQIKNYIHFVDSSKSVKPGHPRFHPLQKIQPFLDMLLKQIRKAYTLGQFLSADESMIKYKGKAIRFVQYMPAKPIKHGIKVFALCCSLTGYIYAFYVYCGKELDDCSATQVVERLFRQDSDLLTNSKGRVLYTDNYYTSEELMKLLYTTYGVLLVGTVNLTKKKSRTSVDAPFHKLSNAAKKLVGRGWIRWAQKTIWKAAGKVKSYVLQYTNWMDRKQIMILHNWLVGAPADEDSVLRYCKKEGKRVMFKAHRVIQDYINKMRGVDRIDRHMADYNISQKGRVYYRRIFYYGINAAFADMKICAQKIVEQKTQQMKDVGTAYADPWKKYFAKKTAGAFDFMVDMGRALIIKGIEMDWEDIHDDTQRPKWMRQGPWKSCDCKKCFHCKHGLTTKYGPPKTPRRKDRPAVNPHAAPPYTATPIDPRPPPQSKSKASRASKANAAPSSSASRPSEHQFFPRTAPQTASKSARPSVPAVVPPTAPKPARQTGESAPSTGKSDRRETEEKGFSPLRSETKKPRVVPGIEGVFRGNLCTLARPHVSYPENRWQISTSVRDCAVCRRLGHKRKQYMKPGETTPVMKQSRMGCPHIFCRDFVVCTDHWQMWRHEDEDERRRRGR
mmetsp:Transcript_28371/g.67599  ORF Transcript_28371/g.67599 Transcript_28371/m.67599 type:complete len:1231 (+) Transcript_28371:374-4066(+)